MKANSILTDDLTEAVFKVARILRAAKGGSAKTAKKRKASAENGRLGGRPRKVA